MSKRPRPDRTPRRGKDGDYSKTYNRFRNPLLQKCHTEIVALRTTINEKDNLIKRMQLQNNNLNITSNNMHSLIENLEKKIGIQYRKMESMENTLKDQRYIIKDLHNRLTQKDLTLKILHAQLGKQFTDLRKVLSLNEHLRKQLDKYLLSSPSAPNGISNSPIGKSPVRNSMRI
jgi:chromosome segregation ATPase